MSVTALAPFLDAARPFELFGGPVNRMAQLTPREIDPGRCDLCGSPRGPRLTLQESDQLIVGPGPRSSDATGALMVSVSEWEETPVAQRQAVAGAGITVCLACAQAGRVAFTKDTEFGMVTWQEALSGRTHGVPIERAKIGQEIKGFTVSSTDTEDAEYSDDGDIWVSVEVPSPWLEKLVATPTYVTWQGETWLFCCSRPMIFVGEWEQLDFERHAVDGDGRLLFEVMTSGSGYTWGDIDASDAYRSARVEVFVFHCPVCVGLDGHVDPT